MFKMDANIFDKKTLESVLLCRVCLESFDKENFLDVSVIYDENEKLTYSDCFFFCTSTVLEEFNGFPGNLCKNCGLELQMAYDFQKKVQEANKILENMFCNEDKSKSSDVKFEEFNTLSTETDEYNYEPDSAVEAENISDSQLVENTLQPEENTFLSVEEIALYESDENNISQKSNSECEDDNELIELSFEQTKEIKKEKSIKQKNPKERTGYCDICHKTFSDASYLPRHKRIHDPQRDRKVYKCPECDKAFPTTSQVKLHLRSHTGEGYLCPVCSKLIYTKHDLEVHMRFHTRDFPFICDVCGKRFALKGHLTYHMSAKHNGLRLSCRDCGKLFQNVSSLRSHSYIHSEMPFHCAYCVKKYPTKHKLKVHIRTKHNIECGNEELEGMRKVQSEKQPHTWTKVEGVDGEHERVSKRISIRKTTKNLEST